MIALTISMKVLPEKRKELLQSIRAWLKLIRNESGCVDYRFHQHTEDDNNFSLVSEWETHADLDRHLLSDRFGIFLGASSLLSEPPELTFHSVLSTTPMETLSTARGKSLSCKSSLKETGT